MCLEIIVEKKNRTAICSITNVTIFVFANSFNKIIHASLYLLKFSLEIRLKSESFKPLINFLAFLVQKL